jgi:hypothetical protein
MALSDCNGNSTIATPCTCLQIDGSLPVCTTGEYCPHNWGDQPLSLGCLPAPHRAAGDPTPLECSMTDASKEDCLCPTIQGVATCVAGQRCDLTVVPGGGCADGPKLPACPVGFPAPASCVCTLDHNCPAGFICSPEAAPTGKVCWPNYPPQ